MFSYALTIKSTLHTVG